MGFNSFLTSSQRSVPEREKKHVPQDGPSQVRCDEWPERDQEVILAG